MEIRFLKAGSGDAILIGHDQKNILVDGGNDSTHLLTEISKLIEKNEVIDLLIITHHDDDHIRGIIELLKFLSRELKTELKTFIRRIAFNSPNSLLPETSSSLNSKTLSYNQAYEVEKILKSNSLTWESFTEETGAIEFGDLKVTVLSPNPEDVTKYQEHQDVMLSSDFKCDWQAPMSLLEKYLDDKSQDRSLPNRCSIVVMLEHKMEKILLTGDSTPDKLNIALEKLVKENKGQAVNFDLIKLPHHGSYRSLNRNLLEKIRCTNFVITTNSKKYFLPNKRGILKVVKFVKRNNTQINFFFNYEETIENLRITEKEKKDFNFNLIYNPTYESI